MSSNFFAYINRMKLIRRWGLMRNTQPENDLEHTMQVVMLAHGMGVIANRRCGAHVDLGRIALLAAYHDAPEVITGDLATPIKYFNPAIKRAFGEIEQVAAQKLAAMLPADLRYDFEPLLSPDESSREWRIVKAADKLSAYIKCVEERQRRQFGICARPRQHRPPARGDRAARAARVYGRVRSWV